MNRLFNTLIKKTDVPQGVALGTAPAPAQGNAVQTDYSQRERAADAVLHAMGVAAAIVAVAVLLREVVAHAGAAAIAAASIYGAGLLATLCLSAAYHLTPQPRWREALRPYDHAAIFLMIAGSYTPFALVTIGGATGAALLAVVWLTALAGVALKLLRPRRLERAALALYLVLGWIGLPLLGPVIAALDPAALLLLGAGGVLYTGGVIFHLWRTLPHHNAIWHACVLAAASCHYLAISAALGVG
jgi:hemolysin III